MGRRRRVGLAVWLPVAFFGLPVALFGCAATQPGPSFESAPAVEIAAPAPAPSPVPDKVYGAITAERQRHGLHAQLDPLLGKKVSEAGSVVKAFSGEPRPTVADGRGGTIQFWHPDGIPWILLVDANGTITGYDVPSQGVSGRTSAPAPAPRAPSASIVDGLDDMVGLPVDALVSGDFQPLDRSKLGDGSRLYTFRTPDLYFLCLSTDEKGVITGWGSTLPGLERPLRSPSRSAR